MEGDENHEIQRQVTKFQKVSCNGSSVISDSSTNPNKIGTHRRNHLFPVGDGGGDGGAVGRLCGWPSSRIVRVSRASGGKDRHSKVVTSKGLRDRRIRLSVSTAIEFYDLQDRLGYDQPSKAVDWLIKAASSSIKELPSLDPSFPGDGYAADNHHQEHNKSLANVTDFEDPNHLHHQQSNNSNTNNNNNNACSSTSETSKGSGLSLSRSENRIRARERARDLAVKKEKVKKTAVVVNTANGSSISSSFTDLLTGGINMNNNSSNNSNPHMDYIQMPQFNNIPTGANQHQQEHHQYQYQYSFLQGNFAPGLASGSNRVTLQSNLVSSLHHHHHHNHHLQRSVQTVSMVDGSTSANFPFFMGPTISSGGADHFQASGYDSQRLQLYGGGDGGDRHSGHYKEKSKN